MKLFLKENVIFQTKLSKKEVLDKLTKKIDVEKAYTGYIFDNTFTIKRLIKYQNSFLPQITGEITENADSTTIHVKMKLHSTVFVFAVIWFGIILITCGFTSYLFFTEAVQLFFLMPHFLLILIFTLMIGIFKWETQKSVLDLKKLWKT